MCVESQAKAEFFHYAINVPIDFKVLSIFLYMYVNVYSLVVLTTGYKVVECALLFQLCASCETVAKNNV